MCIPQFCRIIPWSCALLLALPGHAQSLVWLSSLAEARASALNQEKLILLLAGSRACSHCVYMLTVVCEAPNVRPIIDEIYVPWFTEVGSATDYQPYATGLGPSWSYPLSCMIDPRTTNLWLLRQTGPYAAQPFESFLRTAARLYPPRPSNLVHQQVINDLHYVVKGHIWTNTEPVGVSYRVNVGTNTVNSFTNAAGTTDWTASLAPFLAPGVSNQYTLDLYATFADGSSSATNKLTFSYHPAAAPLKPGISSIGVAAGVVHLTLTNLTAGVTNRIERSLNLNQANGWFTITNFLSAVSQGSISESAPPDRERAFYRISLSP
jgi:hypothetical protein